MSRIPSKAYFRFEQGASRHVASVVLGTTGALLPFYAAAALAQEAATPAELPAITVETDVLPTYAPGVVSMPKFVAPPQEIPQTITVVPEQVMEEQRTTRVTDVLRNVAGITMNAGEGGGAQGDNVSLRGFSARSDFYLDGIRDPGSYNRDSFNLEAVEVVKGPSSSTFGRGATGGAINQATKTPKAREAREVTFGVGTSDSYRATADVNQPLSETVAVRLNAMVEQSDVARRDHVENEQWAVAPSVTFGLGRPTTLTLTYLHQQEEDIPDYGIPVYQGRPLDVPLDTFYGLANRDYEKVQADIATARLSHEFSDDLSVVNTLRYGRTDREFSVIEPMTNDGATVIRAPKTNDRLNTILVNQTDVIRNAEVLGMEHTLQAGVEVARETYDVTSYRLQNVDAATVLDPYPYDNDVVKTYNSTTESTADTIGVYASDRIAITDQWELSGGLRWDHFSAESENVDTGASYDRTDRMLSWRAAVSYKPASWQHYYVSYGTSFNPSAEHASLSSGSATVDPEENRTLEIGAKLSLFDEALSVSGAIFRIEKTNARITDRAAGVTTLEGAQQVDGAELQVAGEVMPGWNVMASYTYLDSEITETNAATASQLGNRLPSTPVHSASLWTTYDVTRDFTIGGGAFYVGDRYGDAANNAEVDGYVRVDAMASYDVTEAVALQLNVYNLFDEEYYEDIYANGRRARPGAGRAAVLSTNVKF